MRYFTIPLFLSFLFNLFGYSFPNNSVGESELFFGSKEI